MKPRSVHWGKPILPGTKYGNLTIVSETEPRYWRKYRKRYFICRCDCGREVVVWNTNLENGHTKTCGCARKTISAKARITHGETGIRLYRTWVGMLSRCRNRNNKSFKHYGAMGVTICTIWMAYEPFRDWAIGHGYRKNLTIERVDCFGNYEPDNCTWIPKSEQSKNRRNSKVNRDRLQKLCQQQ